ncbi:MAG: enolase C-terminal domain-like protein [Akkermansiaceae bacterium]
MPREFPITEVKTSAYQVPTDSPESDGTFAWDSTTLVLVEISAGGHTGTGYTYSAAAAGRLVAEALADVVRGSDALEVAATHAAMMRRIRNLGRGGLARMAVSAVDAALWDLKARLLDMPLVRLLGQLRETLPVYGSGGFTSYGIVELCDQLRGWVELGIPRVKMKVGSAPLKDLGRVRAARQAVGDGAELMVDGNGAFDRKQALEFMHAAAGEAGVNWMEQPLPPEDRAGARLLRDRSPHGMEIADGEYAAIGSDFLELIQAGVADILMPDITRCGGVTGLLQAAEICAAWGIPISTHCAPALHLHPACAIPGLRHAEYFHDHVRIETLLLDGLPQPVDGALRPDLSAPGNGLTFRHADAANYQIL